MTQIVKQVQVNIPFTMLYESYLPRFLEYGINPEIGFDATALDNFKLADFRKIAEQLLGRGLGITIHAPFMDLSPGSPDPAVRELTRHRFQQVLELIPVFKPKLVVSHTGYDHKRYSVMKDVWVQNSLELWTWFSGEIKGSGVVLMLENVYEQHPSEFLGLYENLIDKKIGFCLDTGHQAVFGHASLSSWLEIMGPYISQVHLHDNHGKQDDHLALAEGEIDFHLLFKYLKENRSEPPVITLEPHREEDLWPSIEYLERIWPW